MSEMTEQEAFENSRNPAAEIPPKEEVKEQSSSSTPEVVADPVSEVKESVVPEAVVKPKKAKFDPDAFRTDVMKQFEARESKLYGHIGGLNRQLKALEAELATAKSAAKQVDDAPTQTEINKASKDPEEWEQLKQDWPEWATAIEKKLEAKLENSKAPEFDKDKLISESQLAFETKQREAAASRLERDFPEWRSPERYEGLITWLDGQPDHVKDLASSDWIDDARTLLTMYAKSQQPEEEANQEVDKANSLRQKRIEAAVTPKGSGGHASGALTELEAFENARRR